MAEAESSNVVSLAGQHSNIRRTDDLHDNFGIAAWDFEVGNDIWNPAASRWEGVGFQPPDDETHAESQKWPTSFRHVSGGSDIIRMLGLFVVMLTTQ